MEIRSTFFVRRRLIPRKSNGREPSTRDYLDAMKRYHSYLSSHNIFTEDPEEAVSSIRHRKGRLYPSDVRKLHRRIFSDAVKHTNDSIFNRPIGEDYRGQLPIFKNS